ncbi:MAG TPA: hypothetical protein VMU52_01065 [Steroidobacteraceae bacterium]|nr:hypothetical protein [Steroidobacteraceae bacterium]
MTVLPLPDSRLDVCTMRVCGTTALRAWLAGRWAILFSHPGDFARQEMEMDRWLAVLGGSFETCAVAPVALARAGLVHDDSWLGSLAALDRRSAAVLALEPPPAGSLMEMSAITLRVDIARGGPRFAMIIDPGARCRRTLSYRPPVQLPSPLDLIGWAAALRKRDQPEERPQAMPAPCPAVRSAWPRGSNLTP